MIFPCKKYVSFLSFCVFFQNIVNRLPFIERLFPVNLDRFSLMRFHRPTRGWVLFLSAWIFVVLISENSFSQDLEGAIFPVSTFELSYAHGDHPEHPYIDVMRSFEITLGLIGDVYVDYSKGEEIELISLDDFQGPEPFKFHASAIQSINNQLVGYLNNLGLIGVYVEPDNEDIDKKKLKDLRPPDDFTLHLTIWTSMVKKIRSIASGKRILGVNRLNHSSHDRILSLSPIQPTEEDDQERLDLLRKDVLNRYVSRLNRHPGRRVDIAIASAGNPGEVVLDYLISENKPWLAYAQVSNTGTESTDKIRERFGLIFNQFTKHDDILSLDYITAEFDEAHAIIGSYEFPFFNSSYLRLKVFASWNEFTASEFAGTLPINAEGDSWHAGAELVIHTFQHNNFYMDLSIGAKFENIFVDNLLVDNADPGGKGESDFIIPRLELEIGKSTEASNLLATFDFELVATFDADKEDTDTLSINNLGRLNVDDAPPVFHWNLQHSFFLEPWIFGDDWNDPKTWKTSTLAHEIALSFKGQNSFNNRLIPQKQLTAGGFYTVRGYEESEVVGDDVYIGSIEYRFHVPRAFKPRSPSTLSSKAKLAGNQHQMDEPFKVVPDRVYGRPDWDLILRAFYDFAETEITDPDANEIDESLQSIGFGIEIQFLRYLNLRVDWGYVLDDVEGDDTEEGDSRWHVSASVLW